MNKLLVSACLLGDPVRYDGCFDRRAIAGSGVSAALLEDHGIRVFSQHRLDDAIACPERG